MFGSIPYESLSLADLDALPIGIIRDFRLGQVYVRCQKGEKGWKVLKRYGVPSRALADTPSAAFDPRFSPAQRAEVEPQERSGAANAMHRIADRYPID